jgi:signal transduction histidine kinase/AraC-like DNA-binding protein
MLDTDAAKISNLTRKDGLSDDNVYSVLVDNKGDAWLGTMAGLDRLNIRSGEVTNYYGGNGMKDHSFQNATVSSAGKFYFIGEKGITSFYPGDIKEKDKPNNVLISGLFVNGSKVNSLSKSGNRTIIDGSMMDISTIRLSYRDNLLALMLSTLDYNAAGNVFYEWSIPEFGDSWVRSLPGENIITIPHLNPGNYTLRIKAWKNGEYSEVKEVSINVMPPWYLSTSAKIVQVFIVIVIIVLIIINIKDRHQNDINEAKVKFFIDLSHEIRSPLTMILSPLESLLKKEHDPDTDSKLRTIHRNAGRILSLINQLLDIRKIDKGKMKLTYSETELVHFVRELTDMFRSNAENHNIDLKFETTVNTLDAWIDRNNFDKVLINLLTNAFKFTPSGGEIKVCLDYGFEEAMGEYAEIKVLDTGVGLDEKNVEEIFNRFYQGKSSKSVGSIGFGIGLDLCKMLVSLHHGTITAANRSDVKGSCFTVRIPLDDSHLQEDEKTVEEVPVSYEQIPTVTTSYVDTPQVVRTGKRSPSCKILVVDDDPEIRQYLCDALSKSAKVLTASNGVEALNLLVDSNVDVIVSDVMMPEMDGLTLIKMIRKNVAINHIPIVLLSSKSEIENRVGAWNCGADAFVAKPFNIDELESIIDNLIDSRSRLRGKYSGVQEKDDNADMSAVKGNNEIFMDKIMAIIQERIDDPNLNVEKLGQEIGISRAHLHRKMKELAGISPSDFIRNMRLRRACELLKNKDIDITQVAYIVGFTSQPHFSTAFKRVIGVSPTAYRAKYLGQEEPAVVDEEQE